MARWSDESLHFAVFLPYVVAVSYWIMKFYKTPARFPGIFIRILWWGTVYCMVSPLTKRAIVNVILHVILLIILPILLEIAVDEIRAIRHWFDREPTVGWDGWDEWERVAHLKSSNNGYESNQFYPVTVVDFNQLDDPFWPHASTVYMVEIRRRCLIWRTIIIWRVSLLNGERKQVHQFHDFCRWTDGGNMFGRRLNIFCSCCVRCYQTNGVVAVLIDYSCKEKLIYIYDVRCGKQAVYKVPSIHSIGERHFSLTICCLGRLINNDGTLKGWRFRWIDATWDTSSDSIRASLIRKFVEFGMPESMITQEEIVFGGFFDWPGLLFVRTGHGAFGLEANFEGNARVLMFDPVTGDYIRCFNGEQQMLQFDRFFSRYNSLLTDDRRINHRCPAVLTDRECIEGFSNGTVFRVQFSTPTLKYRAAKMLFRAKRGLRNRMNAPQFRRETGIDGMEGHFD